MISSRSTTTPDYRWSYSWKISQIIFNWPSWQKISNPFCVSAYVCLDNAYQQAVERMLFSQLFITDAEVSEFGQIVVGYRRSYLKALTFQVNISKSRCYLKCDVDPVQQDWLQLLQGQGSRSWNGEKEPWSSPTMGGSDTKLSANDIVTIAYKQLFKLLATWSFSGDHAHLDLVYLFDSTHQDLGPYLDQIRVDVDDIPSVSVITKFASPSYCIPSRTEVDWYVPSFLHLLTRMPRLTGCEMECNHFLKEDRTSTMQIFECKMLHYPRPVFPCTTRPLKWVLPFSV